MGGSRGPLPVPTSVLRMSGSQRASARVNKEPEPTVGDPVCPAWLGDDARVHWDQTLAMLREVPGLLTAIDGGALALYSQALADYLKARAEVAVGGITTEGSTGTTIMNPAVRVMEAAWARIIKHGAQFGLSPADRARVVVDKPKGNGDPKGYFAAG